MLILLYNYFDLTSVFRFNKSGCIREVVSKNLDIPKCIKCVIKSKAYYFSALLSECYRSTEFSRQFCRLIKQALIQSNSCVKLKEYFYTVNIPPERNEIQLVSNWTCTEYINRLWTSIVLHHLSLQIRYENSWAWLSTLGGGHSCLGETILTHALRAEKISKDQLCLARDIGDPNAIIKCYLFIALSYLQQKRFEEVSIILRFQYRCIQSPNITDPRLPIMCRALWRKMKYAQKQVQH